MTTPARPRSALGETGDPDLVTQPLPGQVLHRATPTQSPPPPTSTSTAAPPPAGPRRGLSPLWRRRLRALGLLAVLLVSLVLNVTSTTTAPRPDYRLEVLRTQVGAEGGSDTLTAWALLATAAAAGWATDEQADLLHASPLDTRLLAPAGRGIDDWLQAHQGVGFTLATMVLVGLFGYGMLTRRPRRWWLPAWLVGLTSLLLLSFPAQALILANLPGLATTRQVVNATHSFLLPDLDAVQAEQVQAALAEQFWTGMVTDSHSYATTRSDILLQVPAENRDKAVTLLHRLGVEPARGLEGVAVSTAGLAWATPFTLLIALSSLVGATAQTLLLLLVLSGLVGVLWCATTGRIQTLLRWWLLPALPLLLVIALASLLSVGLTALAVAAATGWQIAAGLISGSAVACLVLWRIVRWTRRRLRVWGQRRVFPPQTTIIRDPQASPAPVPRPQQADAAAAQQRKGVA